MPILEGRLLHRIFISALEKTQGTGSCEKESRDSLLVPHSGHCAAQLRCPFSV